MASKSPSLLPGCPFELLRSAQLTSDPDLNSHRLHGSACPCRFQSESCCAESAQYDSASSRQHCFLDYLCRQQREAPRTSCEDCVRTASEVCAVLLFSVAQKHLKAFASLNFSPAAIDWCCVRHLCEIRPVADGARSDCQHQSDSQPGFQFAASPEPTHENFERRTKIDSFNLGLLCVLALTRHYPESPTGLARPQCPDLSSWPQECQEFIDDLISSDESKRKTAQQLLDHAWVRAEIERLQGQRAASADEVHRGLPIQSQGTRAAPNGAQLPTHVAAPETILQVNGFISSNHEFRPHSHDAIAIDSSAARGKQSAFDQHGGTIPVRWPEKDIRTVNYFGQTYQVRSWSGFGGLQPLDKIRGRRLGSQLTQLQPHVQPQHLDQQPPQQPFLHRAHVRCVEESAASHTGSDEAATQHVRCVEESAASDTTSDEAATQLGDSDARLSQLEVYSERSSASPIAQRGELIAIPRLGAQHPQRPFGTGTINSAFGVYSSHSGHDAATGHDHVGRQPSIRPRAVAGARTVLHIPGVSGNVPYSASRSPACGSLKRQRDGDV